MALTESNTLEIGFKAPEFRLLNTIDGKQISLSETKGKNGTVVLFICNHCPFVVHINEKLVDIANQYQAKGINFIAISSNDALKYPQDGPAQMKVKAKNLSYPFPYLYDEKQSVAKAYDAACTPDIYAFDENLKLAYHGQFDDSRPGKDIPVSGKVLSNALNNILENKTVLNQKASIGCNIKWK